MGFIARIFEAIANIIHDIITAIADVVKWIGKQIQSFFEGIGKWILLGGLLLLFFAPGLMGALVLGVKTIVSSIGSIVWNVGKFAITKTIATIQWLSGTFQSFLVAIHFKELLALHGLAMILSSDYRDMMNKVFKEISAFSYQIFHHVEMLGLLLQGSRQLIYAASSGVGYPVDIAEIEWIQTLDDALTKIAANAERYSDNPELIFDDIAEWVYTPLADKYSAINQGFVLALEGVINGVDAVAQNVFEINEQTQQVVRYLPEPLRGSVYDILKPLDEKITTFQYDIYEPKIAELDGALRQTNDNVYRNKQDMSSLTQRLINPADYLTELDDLEIDEREREKRKISVSINEPFDSDRAELGAGIDDEIEIIEKEKIVLPEPVSKPPDFMTLEPTEKKVPVGRQRIGWSVGDY